MNQRQVDPPKQLSDELEGIDAPTDLPLSVSIPPSTALPTSRQSLPLPAGGVRSTRRQQRMTFQPAVSSLDDTTPPSSPPAEATIPAAEIPPTPSTPHKSAAKRLSLAAERAVESTDSQEVPITTSAPTFQPVERSVIDRQSLPPQQRPRRGAPSRQSAAPRVHYDEADEEEAEEVVMMDGDVISPSPASSHPISSQVEFTTHLPASRHSLPTQTASSTAHTRRQTAAPTVAYEDTVVTVPSLPSPIRRGIVERAPRASPVILHPLLSPVKRAIRRGVVLRPVVLNSISEADAAQPVNPVDLQVDGRGQDSAPEEGTRGEAQSHDEAVAEVALRSPDGGGGGSAIEEGARKEEESGSGGAGRARGPAIRHH